MNKVYLEALDRSRDVDKLEKIMREELLHASEEWSEISYIYIEASTFFRDLSDGGKLFLTEGSDTFQRVDARLFAKRMDRAATQIIDCDQDGMFVDHRVEFYQSPYGNASPPDSPPRVLFTLRRPCKGLPPVHVE
jgi:hypothetical protein